MAGRKEASSRWTTKNERAHTRKRFYAPYIGFARFNESIASKKFDQNELHLDHSQSLANANSRAGAEAIKVRRRNVALQPSEKSSLRGRNASKRHRRSPRRLVHVGVFAPNLGVAMNTVDIDDHIRSRFERQIAKFCVANGASRVCAEKRRAIGASTASRLHCGDRVQTKRFVERRLHQLERLQLVVGRHLRVRKLKRGETSVFLPRCFDTPRQAHDKHFLVRADFGREAGWRRRASC